VGKIVQVQDLQVHPVRSDPRELLKALNAFVNPAGDAVGA